MHDLDNVYVADSSFFVSSTAVNPTLTIFANALRVAERVGERLGVSTLGEPVVPTVRPNPNQVQLPALLESRFALSAPGESTSAPTPSSSRAPTGSRISGSRISGA